MLLNNRNFHTFMLYPAGLNHSKKKIVNAEICTAATTTNNQDAASKGSVKIILHYTTCRNYCIAGIDLVDMSRKQFYI